MNCLKHISLQGAHNVRDLGGYPTIDGRSTCWGMLYRSDALNELIVLIVLISTLYLKLRLVSEVNSFAVKKAIGIPYGNICLQELYPILRAGGTGCLIGLMLSVSFGDDVVSMMFGVLGLGIRKIQFIAIPVEICVLIPFVLLFVLAVVTLLSCRQIKRIEVARYLNED